MVDGYCCAEGNNVVDFPNSKTGVLFFGILPLEKVVFFFITNILIVSGMTLLPVKESREDV
jgi:hypothetical protein